MNFNEYLQSLKGKRAAVLGIGISNRPLIKLLLRAGAIVTACDRKTADALDLEGLEAVQLKLGEGYLDGLEADLIYRTPGMRPDGKELTAAIEKGARLTSEMEDFFDVCPCKIIAVTGSDGKTTTTSLIAELLRCEGYTVHIGGNLGHPLLSDAENMNENDIAVVELSSFQLMTMKKSADIAVVTNVTPNHLDVHRDMDEYIEAKKNVFKYQTSAGKTVLNSDNSVTNGFAACTAGETVMFSRTEELEDGYCLKDGCICRVKNGESEKILNTADIFIPGKHNVENYMAAIAAVEGLVSLQTIRRVAAEFKGVEHRIELVRELNGVKYYNDSIASSPTRTIAGLHSFDTKVILIAGGYDKKIPFDGLGAEIVKHVKKLVLVGATKEKILQAVLAAEGYEEGKPEIYVCEGFAEAVEKAKDIALPGDIVTMSPACASFDLFKNFETRGREFKRIVNGFKEE